MSLSDELAYRSLTSLASSIRRRELSPVEVVDAFIDRIRMRNPAVNAFVCEDFDRAHDEAVVAEKKLTDGSTTGPLHGIPVAIKDLFSSKPGTPMTMGGVRAMNAENLKPIAILKMAKNPDPAGRVQKYIAISHKTGN